MLTGMHMLIYSDDPTATRAFFKDVLQWPYAEGERGDGGVGGEGTGGADPAEWLIFGTGRSELGVHPTNEGSFSAPRHHEITLMCDDVETTRSELEGRGAQFSGGIEDLGFGLCTFVQVPGADDVMIYQPKHATAYDT